MASRRRRAKLLAGFASLGVLLMLATSAAATDEHIEISIPVDTVVRAQQGSTTELATVPVPDELFEHVCEVRAYAENQSSTHPGNDLAVESGDSMVLLPDVEAEPGLVIETDDQLELDEVITVTLHMGPDELFSAGLEVVVECPAEETTTTTTADVSPTEETTTTADVSPTEETTTTADVSPTEETTTTADVSPTSESTSSSIEDEVKGIEVLPFTGAEDLPLGLFALALFAAGVLVLLSTRRTND